MICVIATVLDEICYPLCPQPVRSSLRDYPHLERLQLADYHRDDITLKVDLLLGADYYYEFVGDVIVRGKSMEPVAVKSKLGWLLSGPVEQKLTTHSNLSSIHTPDF